MKFSGMTTGSLQTMGELEGLGENGEYRNQFKQSILTKTHLDTMIVQRCEAQTHHIPLLLDSLSFHRRMPSISLPGMWYVVTSQTGS
jgi:hypothetical protein